MTPEDQIALTTAIENAIHSGFASIDTSTLRPSGDIPPPPYSERRVSPLIDTSEVDAKEAKKASGSLNTLKKVSSSFTGFTGAVMKGLGETTKIMLDSTAAFNMELDDELDYFRQIQKSFGGISTAAYAAGEEVSGLAGQALNAQQHLGLVGAAGKDAALEIESGALKGKNALLELFKEPAEAAKLFSAVMVDVALDNLTVAQSIEAQGEAEMERVAIISKRMNISADTMGDMLRRQYAFTGEASSKIFEDIANVSVGLAKTTGAAANELKSDILDIMKDTKLFGDIGVESAGRIAVSLNKLGIDFQTFKNMTSSFMDFDSAAEKMGDMSALFGIQIDAMEMTYLANEDQEEFLYRMREEILDAGLDVENMSKTKQRALTDQLGMESIEQMRQYMDTGIILDQEELTASTGAAMDADGMKNAIENFGGAFEGAYRGSAELEKSLRNQARYTDEIARGLTSVVEESGKLPGTMQNIKIPKEALDNALMLLSLDKKMVKGFREDVVPEMMKMAELAAGTAASFTKKALEAAGIEAISAEGIKVSGQIETKLSEEGRQDVESVNAAVVKSSEQQVEIQNTQQEITANTLSMQSDVTSLIGQLKENQNVNVTLSLNANNLSSTVFDIIQEKNGGLIVFNPVQ